jgi:hypothetical protein
MPVHYTPASVRALKARLRPFTQPKFLGGLTGLSLIAFGIWMYGNRVDPTLFSWETLQNLNPQSWFAPSNNSIADEQPVDPAEVSATAADIESSDVLKQLLSGQTPPVTAPQSTKDGQKTAGIPGVDKDKLSAESILQRLSGATTGTTAGTTSGTTPGTTALQTFGTPTLNPSTTGLSGPLAGSPSGSIAQSIILGTGYSSPNPSTSNTTAPPSNALQAAFDRNNARTAAAPQNPIASETAPSFSPSLSPILSPSEPLPPPPGFSPPSVSSSQSLPVLPLTSTADTSAPTYSNSPTSPSPYSANVTPVNPKPVTASPLPSPLPALPPSATSNYDYNYGAVPAAPVPTTPYPYTAPSPSYPTATPQATVQPLPTQPAAPYSVDNPIPGRVLGGGEINTFGNP